MKLYIARRQFRDLWNEYVFSKDKGSVYHLFEWGDIIKKTYGHKPIFLMALRNRRISGVLPLFLMRSPLFTTKKLVSIPFFDYSGIISDSEEVESFLIEKAMMMVRQLNTATLKIRQKYPLRVDKYLSESTDKIIMLKSLPNNPKLLMSSFKSKLRSQIRRPLKEGMYVKIGREELLEDFYKVFSYNMRDLGSPVHSKKLIKNILRYIPQYTKIFIAYYDKKPIACALTIGIKDMLENPWASSLKKYNKYSPNMLLYWKMLKYASESGYKYFSFGRSSYGSGTYKFKKQWETKIIPLYWYYYPRHKGHSYEIKKYKPFIDLWKRLPIPFTNFLGPYLRRYIDL